MKVKAKAGGWFAVGAGQRLKHDADGLFDGRRYLIRAPLRVGAVWQSIPKPGVIERFRIVRVGSPCPKALLPAPTCLAVEARQQFGDRGLMTRWWYGEGLGLLQVEVYRQDTNGSLTLQLRSKRTEKAKK